MITPFYFEQELFDDISIRTLPVVNHAILDMWHKCGCLAFCNENKDEIIKAINSVPTKYKQKWVTALTSDGFKKYQVQLVKSKLSELDDIADFERCFYSKKVVTGILTSDYDEIFHENRLIVNGIDLEVITPNNFNESINFAKSKMSCESDINAGSSFNDVWNDRFSSLVAHSNKITIIDRYLALNLERDIRDGHKTSLECLFERLSSYGTKYSIDIFSACDIHNQSVSADKIKDYINAVLKKKPYFSEINLQIKFSLCKNKIFGEEAHDRMICIGQHVVQIGKGMEIFRAKDIENNTFTIKPKHLSFFNTAYTNLSRNREWRYIPS
ncbi:hypothetical protein [Shewanella metallivivens]|uniref:Uncharacterized protein n=1 Tax=Shewanella metallivivens TaxID=2872342 RepID=A0ABT5TIT1_9GAMM|nr:hypothetical protein [Shewanella metallivivens]MDD8058507.1 hypothetical protein [Shewanella metallivivens]